MKKLLSNQLIGLLGLLATCGTAYAGGVGQIPEPSVLSLFVAGGIAAAVVAIRNRRK